MNILTILEYNDMPLRRGFYEDGEHDFKQTLNAGQFKVDITVFQKKFVGNERSFPDSPPEAEVYATDVTRFVINEMTFLPIDYEMYDLDFEISAKQFDINSLKDSLKVLFQNYMDDDNDEYAKEYKEKVLPYAMNNIDAIANSLLKYLSSVEHQEL